MVHFVGAGPGAVDLITVRGQELLKKADIVIYAGSLVNVELLELCREDARLFDSARMTLEEVMEVIREASLAGEDVVRLHSGDPSIYGAIREQIDELCKLGISYDITPGVTAAMGAAASLGVEYTLPGVTQTFVITRMKGRTDVPDGEKIEELVKTGASVAVYLSAGMTKELTERLMAAGIDGDTPAAMVYKCSWKEEKRYAGTLKELPEAAEREGMDRSAVILIGQALGQSDGSTGYDRSKLYDPSFTTGYRKGER